MRVLILGGSGLIGAPAARAFLAGGHDVAVLARGVHPLVPGARGILADRGDATALQAALADQVFDAVVDLLAYDGADVDRLRSALGSRTGRYLLVSTGQVYLVAAERRPPSREADAEMPPMAEPPADTRDHGQWTYGMGKRAAERAAREWGAARGVSVTALRLPVVQGAGDPSRRLWAYLQRLLDGGPLLMPDAGQLVRFVWADDVARALVSIAEGAPAPAPAYNLAAPDEQPLHEFVAAAAAIVGVEPRFVPCTWDDVRAAGLDHRVSTYSGPWCSRPDPGLARRDLGFVGTPTGGWLPDVVRAHREEPDPAPHPGYASRDAERALATRLAHPGGR